MLNYTHSATAHVGMQTSSSLPARLLTNRTRPKDPGIQRWHTTSEGERLPIGFLIGGSQIQALGQTGTHQARAGNGREQTVGQVQAPHSTTATPACVPEPSKCLHANKRRLCLKVWRCAFEMCFVAKGNLSR